MNNRGLCVTLIMTSSATVLEAAIGYGF